MGEKDPQIRQTQTPETTISSTLPQRQTVSFTSHKTGSVMMSYYHAPPIPGSAGPATEDSVLEASFKNLEGRAFQIAPVERKFEQSEQEDNSTKSRLTQWLPKPKSWNIMKRKTATAVTVGAVALASLTGVSIGNPSGKEAYAQDDIPVEVSPAKLAEACKASNKRRPTALTLYQPHKLRQSGVKSLTLEVVDDGLTGPPVDPATSGAGEMKCEPKVVRDLEGAYYRENDKGKTVRVSKIAQFAYSSSQDVSAKFKIIPRNGKSFPKYTCEEGKGVRNLTFKLNETIRVQDGSSTSITSDFPVSTIAGSIHGFKLC